MKITIDDTVFDGFSFSYKVGLDLITYQFDGETELLYCEGKIHNRTILDCIRKRTDGLHHCVRNVLRWNATGMVPVIPNTTDYRL